MTVPRSCKDALHSQEARKNRLSLKAYHETATFANPVTNSLLLLVPINFSIINYYACIRAAFKMGAKDFRVMNYGGKTMRERERELDTRALW